jgi:predicted HicB family RNase H-like nuclease
MQTPLVVEKLTLRLPTGLHQRLRDGAVENGRSLNAEIVQRLRRSLEAPARMERNEQ